MVIPTLEKCLSIRVSISLKMSHILMALVVVGVATIVTVRYRVTTKYSRLSNELDNGDEEDQVMATDMWREPTDSDMESLVSEKTPTSMHFDEFLKAIKVFGFLDHEVFTQLTKSTQTLRIQQGEQVKLTELGGFAVVISGAMKVYCQSEVGDGEYDLLNEVTVASPISSLSSILSLFSHGMESQTESSEFDRVNATTIAVASEHSTIVIIPADAFRELTSNYPTAAANIVQIILFRWSQVTFRTCQRYLNLTQEFYGTERSLNTTARSKVEKHLPAWLIDDAVRQLKARAAESGPGENIVELRLSHKNQKKPFGAPYRESRRTSTVDVPLIRPALGPSRNSLNAEQLRASESHNVYLGSDNTHTSSEYPGDLLSHALLNYDTNKGPATRHGSLANISTEPCGHRRVPTKDSEETVLRRAIVETMFSAIMFDAPLSEESQQFSKSQTSSSSAAASTSSTPQEQQQKKPQSQGFNIQVQDSDENSSLFSQRSADSSQLKGRQSAAGSPSIQSGGYPFFGTDDVNDSPSPTESSIDDGISGDRPFQRPRSQTTSESRSGPSRFASARPHTRPPPTYSEVVDDATEMIELLWYKKGEYITRYGERCRGLIYVLDGSLEVGCHTSVHTNDSGDVLTTGTSLGPTSSSSGNNHYQRIYDVETGNITGFLETISSYSSFVDLIAKRDTCVAIISKDYFERLAEIYPLLYISAAKALTTSLTRPMVQLDFALEWISIKSGGRLLHEGSAANAIYFVLNGRMRAYHQQKLIGDYGYGSTIGELETMGGENYSATVVAVRDTELSRFPRTLVKCLARQYPSITFEMSRMIVQAMHARNSLVNPDETIFSDFKTLAVLPTAQSIPVEDFAVKLSSAFQAIGREVKVLTNSVVLRYLGKYAFHKMGSLKLRAYLADLEDRYDILLYVADGLSTSQWSRTCVDQADCVLLLADAASQPVFSEVERMVIRSPTRSRAHLVLLHNEKQVKHGSTARWLKHRPWISAHHHIEMSFAREDDTALNQQRAPSLMPGNDQNRVQRKIKEIKNKVQDEIRHRKFLRRPVGDSLEGTDRLQYKNDFNRLARVLAGEAVGLVLGGGGARGLSHIGVLQALEEAGIPIDMVGGTSIGSLIGGLYAQDYDIMPLLRKSKQFSARVSSFWRLILDLTYPMTAWTTGHAFNRAVWKCLGDSRIEDFWVKYFTNTTNLTLSRMEVHQRGYAWRYIRASMSLAGLLPPIEEKGQMLLDGGYVDNLPVFEMKKMGARYIIAVDVGAVDDTTPLKYGDTLSGMWALINKYNPLSTTPNVPNIAEIQQRLTYVSSVKALEEAKSAKGVIYLRPPIDNFATLDFAKFDEIRQVGFTYGSKTLQEQIADNKLPTVYPRNRSKRNPRMKYRRYSF